MMTYKGPMWVPHGLKFLYGTHMGPIWASCPDSAHMGPICPCVLGNSLLVIFMFMFGSLFSSGFVWSPSMRLKWLCNCSIVNEFDLVFVFLYDFLILFKTICTSFLARSFNWLPSYRLNFCCAFFLDMIVFSSSPCKIYAGLTIFYSIKNVSCIREFALY